MFLFIALLDPATNTKQTIATADDPVWLQPLFELYPKGEIVDDSMQPVVAGAEPL